MNGGRRTTASMGLALVLLGTAVAGVAAQSPAASMAPGGTLDAAFGTGGIAVIDLGGADDAIHGLVAAWGVAPGPDGSILIAGDTTGDALATDGVLVRYLPPAP